MSNEQETVSVSIPAPPKGWKIDGYRNVRNGELCYHCGVWVFWEKSDSPFHYPCAIREQSEAEKRGLEVGCFYAGQHDYLHPDLLIEILDGFDCMEHRSTYAASAQYKINQLTSTIEWRKVFDADGNPCEVDENGELFGPYEDEKPTPNELPEEQPEPEYEEIPVYTENGWQMVGDWLAAHWACLADFAGTIYEHPNGHRKTFGFTHPIFVRAASQAAIWDWSHAETKQHTHMIRPVAIRRKVAK